MAETISEIRKRSWKTRREKYGVRGHSGTYGSMRPIYTARWNERLGMKQKWPDVWAAASRLRAGEGQPLERECVFCGFKWFPKIDDEPCPHHDELHNTKPTSSPLGRQDEHPSGYDNPLTMDRILQLAHVLCKCPPEYRSSWSCDPCRAFAELIFFRQSAATPVSVGGEDAPSDPGKYEGMNGSETWDRPDIDYPSPQKCGNSNHGLKARMTCVLPKGHTGNHEDSAKCWWRNS